MKRLYIVRHAKAVSHSDHDFERTLAESGKADATAMGNALAEKQIKPDLILASPAARTLATASLIAVGVGYGQESVRDDRRIYNAEPDRILRVIRETKDEVESLMIVGHNPGITEFSNGIYNTMITSFPTAGITGGTLNVDSWKDVKWGIGKQEFFISPEEL